MFTSNLLNKITKSVEGIWAWSISNPLTVIEQQCATHRAASFSNLRMTLPAAEKILKEQQYKMGR